MKINSMTPGIAVSKPSPSQRDGKPDFAFSIRTTTDSASSAQVTLSDAARAMNDRATQTSRGKSEAMMADGIAFRDVNGGLRLPEGAEVRSLAEVLIEKNGTLTITKLTDSQLAEVNLHAIQAAAREAAISSYAQQHPDPIYGQVMVDGKLFATVWASGPAETPYPIPMTTEGEGTQLAEARLQDIAKAVNGKVVYSGFTPVSTVSYKPIPDSVMASMPQVTARSSFEILQDVLADPELAAAQSLTFTSVEQWREFVASQSTTVKA